MYYLIVFCLIVWFTQPFWMILLAAYFADQITKQANKEFERKLSILNESLGW